MFARPRSASTRTTRWPYSPRAIARFSARFDVPTPPLPLVRTSDRAAAGASAVRAGGGGSATAVAPDRAWINCLSPSAWSDMASSRMDQGDDRA